jgi:hypothetical protein
MGDTMDVQDKPTSSQMKGEWQILRQYVPFRIRAYTVCTLSHAHRVSNTRQVFCMRQAFCTRASFYV